MKFIAVCGLNGSGKGVVAEIIKKKYLDTIYISARDLIYKAAEKESIQIYDRDGLNAFNEERGRNKRLVYHDVIENFDPFDQNKLYVFESVRRVAEIKKYREHFGKNFVLIAVDANEEIRYNRIKVRRSETDDVSLAKFREQELKENTSDDDFVMNISRCMELADYKILNESTLGEFEQKVSDTLSDILSK